MWRFIEIIFLGSNQSEGIHVLSLNGNHHLLVVSKSHPFTFYLFFSVELCKFLFSFYRTGCAMFPKKSGREKTCTRVEFGPSKIDGHSMVTVVLFSQCTWYAQNYNSFLNLQDMCNIIQVNVNISNTHWRWKSIWVIEGNTSVSQVGGKLQIVQVILCNLPCFKYESFQLIWLNYCRIDISFRSIYSKTPHIRTLPKKEDIFHHINKNLCYLSISNRFLIIGKKYIWFYFFLLIVFIVWPVNLNKKIENFMTRWMITFCA